MTPHYSQALRQLIELGCSVFLPIGHEVNEAPVRS